MKKLVFLLSFLGLVLSAHGQEIVRTGNRYTVDGQTFYNSTAFRGYLKNTSPELFAQYNQGYKLGMAGWGLLAAGAVVMPLGFMEMALNHNDASGKTLQERADDRTRYHQKEAIYEAQMLLGAGMAAAGVVLLGFGYHKMHKAVDTYNVSQVSASPQTYWSINASANGLGVAYNF